ncbi:MAG: hypothetical protein V3S69_06890 [Dehalococcoidales bacterium]
MAAKVISISNDGGSNYNNLPGSEGSFEVNGEAIDDTILGQTYQSNEVGLVDWKVSSNGIFKGFAGYLAEIYDPGTPTGMTDEATTLVSGKTYQIDDITKRMLDRGVAIIIDDAASPVAAVDILNIDYLFGRVTFTSGYSVSGAITFDTASYLPLVQLARANSYTLTMTADAIDESDFVAVQANAGTRIFTPGLRSVNLELGGIFDDAASFKDVITARTELIISLDVVGDGSTEARGFFKLATTSQGGAVGALEDETLNFNLQVPVEETNPAVEFPFQWQFTATTLQQSLQDCLTSWLTELNTYDVNYLPQGTTGQSPLDGITGEFMVSDISLSGGLAAMNVFTVELQGTGQFTVV